MALENVPTNGTDCFSVKNFYKKLFSLEKRFVPNSIIGENHEQVVRFDSDNDNPMTPVDESLDLDAIVSTCEMSEEIP